MTVEFALDRAGRALLPFDLQGSAPTRPAPQDRALNFVLEARPRSFEHMFRPHQPGAPTASALIRCTTLLPVPNSRATFKMPLPLASAARMAASVAGSTPALP